MSRRRLFSAACIAATAAATVAVVAVAASAPVGVRPHARVAEASAAGTDVFDRFAALRQPAASAVPAALARDADLATRFGVDMSKARVVVPVGGDRAHPWYLLPGKGHLCYYDGAGGGCSSFEGALRGGLGSLLVAHPPAPGTPASADVDRSMTIQGIVPDGVTSVRAFEADGTAHDAPVVNGTYRVSGSGLTRLAFLGDDPPPPLTLGG